MATGAQPHEFAFVRNVITAQKDLHSFCQHIGNGVFVSTRA
jgi:hypothetical protein